jgi:hypothetical protein
VSVPPPFVAVVRAGALGTARADGAGGVDICSRNRRTTGASIVEDAERTNSPISCSVPRRVLLSTPSSLASS